MAKDSERDTEAPAEPAHTFGNRRSEHRTGSEVSEDLGAPKDAQIEDTAPQEVAVEGALGPAPDLAVVDSEALQIEIIQPERGIGCKMPYEIYRASVLLMREGVTPRDLQKKYGYGGTTFYEIKARHADIIPSHAQMVNRRDEDLMLKCQDKMAEGMDNGKLSVNQIPFAYGVINTNYANRTGSNVSKSLVIHASVDKNDLGSLLSGAKAKAADYKSTTDDDSPHKNSVDV